MSLELVPVTFREAKRFISAMHRHNPQLVGSKAVIGAAVHGTIVGVAVVGRPSARHMQDGWTAEITRICTDGHRNACSFLYGASARLARALGYRRAFTYNNKSESGTSLRALGWIEMYDIRGRSWNTPSRPRVDKHSIEDRTMWLAFDERGVA